MVGADEFLHLVGILEKSDENNGRKAVRRNSHFLRQLVLRLRVWLRATMVKLPEHLADAVS